VADAGMSIDVQPDHEAISRRGAEIISEAVDRKPDLLLCAATGSSPTRMYALLAERARAEPTAWSRIRVLKLDEWAGLSAADEGSCENYLRRHLLNPLGVTPDRYEGLRGDAPDLAAECARVERWLDRHGPIDLCVLGIGLNGHLALNEPADILRPRPHAAVLDESTRDHPMIAHARHRVTHGLTLGVGDLLRSRAILLLASGEAKREPLRRALAGEVSTRFPASLLSLHNDVCVVCDQAAAAG
jgi:galactosamine-6-phosphate isomerase